MLDEGRQRLQCACSATFPTSDGLYAHLNEYRDREDYLKNEITKCQSHSKVAPGDFLLADDGNLSSDEDVDAAGDTALANEGVKGRSCPSTGCPRTKPFSKRKELRIHYRKHVDCSEVCVYCHQVFRLASAYLRHTHKEPCMDMSKSAYMAQRRAMIVTRVDEALDLVETTKKRKQTEADLDAAPVRETPATAMEALSTANRAQDVNQGSFNHASSLPADLQANSVDDPSSTVEGINMPSGSISVDAMGQATGLNSLDYVAPVNMVINLPPAFHPAWPGWIWNEGNTDLMHEVME